VEKVHLSGEPDRIVEVLVRELAQDPEVVFAYLYGSCAESRPFRDIDVGVYLKSPSEHSNNVLDLMQRLGSELKLPVDVRILNHAPLSFLYHVLKGELLISNDDDLLSLLIENTTRQYLDIAPLRRQATKEAFG
jgi:predicted nucleotidyltransferase